MNIQVFVILNFAFTNRRMWDDEDLLREYLVHYTTGTVEDPLEGCDRQCQIDNYLCKFKSGTFDQMLECRK